MPRTEEQNQEIKDKRRAKIMKSAIRVFAREGYNKVAIDAITKAANCSHGLFYHYFKNKEDIIEAIVYEYITPNSLLFPCKEALGERGSKGVRTLLKKLDTILSSSSISIASAAIGFHLCEYSDLPTKELRKLASETDLRATLIALVEQGQAEKKIIGGEPKEIALAVYSIIDNNFNRLLENGKKTSVVSSDVIYNMLLRGDRDE